MAKMRWTFNQFLSFLVHSVNNSKSDNKIIKTNAYRLFSLFHLISKGSETGMNFRTLSLLPFHSFFYKLRA